MHKEGLENIGWSKALRLLISLILIGVLLGILYKGIAPSGKINYIYDFCEKECNSFTSRTQSFFIGKLTPDTRVEPILDGKQRIIGDPVYFNMHTSRKFDTAKLTLKYKNKPGSKNEKPGEFIEAGILADNVLWRYNLKPIENKIIDKLAEIWPIVEEDGVILLQRDKVHYSIAEFLHELPQAETIALYNYDLKQEYIIPDYEPENQEKILEYALRGPYQFYTYLKDEDLDYGFVFQDLNKNKDSDPIYLQLYYGDQLIDTRSLEDDGIKEDNEKILKERKLEFKLKNMPEGVYKIELRVNDDIVTQKIETKQTKIAFLGKMRIANKDNKNISLYTDSKNVKALTTNPGKLQTIKVGASELKLDQTYKQYSLKTEGGLANLSLAHDDIILAGDGVFSFNKNAILNPAFRKVDENLDFEKDGIDYILARYSIPKETKDGWKIASAEFDLNKAYQEKGSSFLKILGGGDYSFLISIPSLAEEESKNWIEIDEIRIDLEGKNLREMLKR